MPAAFRPAGRSRADVAQEYEQARGSASQRLYGRAWRKASRAHLHASPLCRYCELDGRVTAASLVDHLYPHRGKRWLFWLRPYWVSSCAPCHSGFKQAVERKGKAALDALARRLGLPPLRGDGPPG